MWVVIALNVLVYAAWHSTGEAGAELMAGHFLVSLDHLRDGRVWTLLTSAFSHIEPGHLLLNMFALWMFGRDIALRWGQLTFVQLVVVGGILASLGHVTYSWLTGDPTPALGASGAVMALAAAYAVLYPRRRLYLFGAFPAPAALMIAGFAVIDVMGAVSGGSRIAHAAHLAGAGYGLAYALLRVHRAKASRGTDGAR